MANIKSVTVETQVLGANQHVVFMVIEGDSFFQRRAVLHSYNKAVAARVLCRVGDAAPSITYVRSAEFDSVTTSKHINKWMEGAPVEIRKVSQFDIENLLSVSDDNENTLFAGMSYMS